MQVWASLLTKQKTNEPVALVRGSDRGRGSGQGVGILVSRSLSPPPVGPMLGIRKLLCRGSAEARWNKPTAPPWYPDPHLPSSSPREVTLIHTATGRDWGSHASLARTSPRSWATFSSASLEP